MSIPASVVDSREGLAPDSQATRAAMNVAPNVAANVAPNVAPPERSPWALPLRAIAIAIAVAAVVDPSFQRDRRVRPEISVIAGGNGATSALLSRTRATLARDFTVLDTPFGGASATVVVGNSL